MFHLGIVGHRYLSDVKTVEFVSQECRAILMRTLADHNDVIALSAIAEGADTLFAEAAVALEIPLEIVRPFSDYASDFTTAAAKRRYEKLRAFARREAKLDHEERSGLAYQAAMKWIVIPSDLLVVAWNGKPPRGSGGTGEAVKQAVDLKRPWVHLDVNNLSVKFHLGQTDGS